MIILLFESRVAVYMAKRNSGGVMVKNNGEPARAGVAREKEADAKNSLFLSVRKRAPIRYTVLPESWHI